MTSAHDVISQLDSRQILGDDWPALVQSTSRHTSPVRVYINEDLTRPRAEAAAFARDMKRRKIIDDTWTRDGTVYIKRGSTVLKAVTKTEIELLLK